MDKLLVDTNIVLDLLASREEFLEEAQTLFTLADQGKLKLYVSALTIANTQYILSESLKYSNARKILSKFKVLIEVIPLDDKIIDLALVSDFKDFEDAIQYYSAIEYQLDMILTRNIRDFKNSTLPCFSAKEYLQLKGIL